MIRIVRRMTEKQSANKPMKDRTVLWLQEHLFLVISIILFLFFSFLIGIASMFGIVAVFSEAMLKALIGAIGVILGFFEAIFVYALTSFDKKFSMFNTAWFEQSKNKMMTPEYAKAWMNGVKNLDKNKKKLVINSLITDFCLVSSLLLAVFSLASFSVVILFVCIFQIFWTIYDLGKDSAQSSR